MQFDSRRFSTIEVAIGPSSIPSSCSTYLNWLVASVYIVVSHGSYTH